MKILKYNYSFKNFIVLVIIFILCVGASLEANYNFNNLVTPHKKNKSKIKKITAKKDTKMSLKKSKSKKKCKKRVRMPRPVKFNGREFICLSDTTFVDGIKYKTYKYSDKKYHIIVNVLEADLNNSKAGVEVLKACSQITELDKLHSIIAEKNDEFDILGGINANFWRAYTNIPIGPTISGGEPIEIKSYKRWSSVFWGDNGNAVVDRFQLKGEFWKKSDQKFSISGVNYRRDSIGMVLYNRFGGDTIPYISHKTLDKELSGWIEEREFDDSTDAEYDSTLMKKEIAKDRRNNEIEYFLDKLIVQYLQAPAINTITPCKIISISNRAVGIPRNGCVISLGASELQKNYFKIGDTVFVSFTTDIMQDFQFKSAVTGTPRIVRNGVAAQEASVEGSRSRRFIYAQLPRTAIGTDKTGTKLYLAAIQYPNSKEKRIGAALKDIAEIMQRLGASDAINLDGGGSSILVVNGQNILCHSRPDYSRRLSVGVGVVRYKNEKNQNQKKS